MSGIPAPNCQHEGCGNKTWYGYCHQHRLSGAVQAPPPVAAAHASRPAAVAPPMYASPEALWADMLTVFPDAGDAVDAATIRQEALDTMAAAVDSEACRRFRELDVEDPYRRNELIDQMRTTLVAELTPEASRVTAEEARELAASSADHFGRSAEDSRYLAAYALGAEWEFQRQSGTVVASYEQFVADAAPQMQAAIDTSFRRNLSELDQIIAQTTGRPPLCAAPLPPGLALPFEPVPDPDPEPEYSPEVQAEIAQWFVDNQHAQQQGYQSYPQQPAAPGHGQPAPEAKPSGLRQLWEIGKAAAIDYITDPNGEWEARRAAKALDEAEAQRIAARREREELDLALDRELLKDRIHRNNRRSSWWR